MSAVDRSSSFHVCFRRAYGVLPSFFFSLSTYQRPRNTWPTMLGQGPRCRAPDARPIIQLVPPVWREDQEDLGRQAVVPRLATACLLGGANAVSLRESPARQAASPPQKKTSRTRRRGTVGRYTQAFPAACLFWTIVELFPSGTQHIQIEFFDGRLSPFRIDFPCTASCRFGASRCEQHGVVVDARGKNDLVIVKSVAYTHPLHGCSQHPAAAGQ